MKDGRRKSRKSVQLYLSRLRLHYQFAVVFVSVIRDGRAAIVIDP